MAKSNADSETSKSRKWIDGLKAEFAKIIWPTREDVTKETTAVVVVSVLLGAVIAMIDFIVQNGVDVLVNLHF